MLNSYEKGYAVMNKELNAYSFESTSLETCKSYCREGSVIVERISYINGLSLNFTWSKWYKWFSIEKRYREANIFKFHLTWIYLRTHRNGKIVYRNEG